MTTSAHRRSDPASADFRRETDPSENVKALNDAANKRQDDLRLALGSEINLHLSQLEKSVDARFLEVKALIAGHDTADADQFNAVRREMSQHGQDDVREHASILVSNQERMTAMKDLLSASIDGVNAATAEVKKNLDDLAKVVTLNQTNSV